MLGFKPKESISFLTVDDKSCGCGIAFGKAAADAFVLFLGEKTFLYTAEEASNKSK